MEKLTKEFACITSEEANKDPDRLRRLSLTTTRRALKVGGEAAKREPSSPVDCAPWLSKKERKVKKEQQKRH